MTTNKFKYFSVPSIITLSNLLCGVLAVYYAFEHPNKLYYASFFIIFAAVLDFFDGFAARMLNSVSEFGKQLDSLSDLVSFGLAPASILFQILKDVIHVKVFSFGLPAVKILILILPILIVLFSALRLAKFNIDERQTENFMGLPTPATAIFFASIPLISELSPRFLFALYYFFDINLPMFLSGALMLLLFVVFESSVFYIVLIFIFAFLMISELPMFSLKFKNLSFKDNKIRYFFLGIAVLILLFLQLFSIPFIIILYIIFSLTDNIVKYIKSKI